MQQVVERLLDLARVEKRRGLESVEPIDTAALLDDIVQSRSLARAARGQSVEMAKRSGTVVRGERFLLRQAIANLLDNAIDFSPTDGVISLCERLADGTWRVAVCDQGPGVPHYARERVFERFYSLARPGGGSKSSGLGLSFVREVALLHGGAIDLENLAAGGVRATLSVPVHANHTPGS